MGHIKTVFLFGEKHLGSYWGLFQMLFAHIGAFLLRHGEGVILVFLPLQRAVFAKWGCMGERNDERRHWSSDWLEVARCDFFWPSLLRETAGKIELYIAQEKLY